MIDRTTRADNDYLLAATRQLRRASVPGPHIPRPRTADTVLRCLLLATLRQRGCATWRELDRVGLDRAAVLHAIGLCVATGRQRIRVGPALIELEEDDA